MCRIVGIKTTKQETSQNIKEIVCNMRDTLAHGGPDAANLYLNETKTVALGHRRLSILDLSDAGTQPLHWGNWVICYNGEIYNFEEIRKKLPDYEFTTGTDTEVIIKSFDKWGLEAVKYFRGMYAFALYNKHTKKLLLCRDRVGVKPLYWYKKNDLFMFASELKAFHKHPNFDKTIDEKAVGLYLQQGYISAPHCIFKYAHKLDPGHFLTIDQNGEVPKTGYWDIKKIYENSAPDFRSEAELLEELESILKDSFKLRMVADVPVGMFLSGGIDSSIVTAILQKESNTTLNTFTIGFEQKEKNEAPFAKKIAEHIGTNHTELICTENDFKRIIPKLPEIYDEPFGDSSGIPTHLVAGLAKQKVKVSLSADGGDELFGGYTKYEIVKNYYEKISRIPKPVRLTLNKLVQGVNPDWLDTYNTLPILRQYSDISNKFQKFQNAFGAASVLDFFNASSSFLNSRQIEKYTQYHYPRFDQEVPVKQNQIISLLGMIDVGTYLEGDIMTKVDRATMHVALEGREPFLDQHIVEFSQTLPDCYKISGKHTKYLLRKILYQYVPKELIERPKQGFSIPIKDWLLGNLKKDLLDLQNNVHFYEVFELSKTRINTDISDFIGQKRYVNPNFIWFLYVLHQWYKRWIL